MSRKPRNQQRQRNTAATPKYSIAVASELSGVPQQQLRRMEESGLIAPRRTEGNTRRYSDDDLVQISQVGDLVDEGINAAGIRYIRTLRRELIRVQDENMALRQQLADLRGDQSVEPEKNDSNGRS
jgi:MerR family transcriptional regulator, heat shock protein HspR